MPYLSLELTKKTWDALHTLADIVESDSEDERDRLVQLVEEALGTFEWIVYQQQQGHSLVVLTDDDMKMLERGDTHGEREVIECLFPGKEKEVREYFAKAA